MKRRRMPKNFFRTREKPLEGKVLRVEQREIRLANGRVVVVPVKICAPATPEGGEK
jgi:hypothetical protein